MALTAYKKSISIHWDELKIFLHDGLFAGIINHANEGVVRQSARQSQHAGRSVAWLTFNK